MDSNDYADQSGEKIVISRVIDHTINLPKLVANLSLASAGGSYKFSSPSLLEE